MKKQYHGLLRIDIPHLRKQFGYNELAEKKRIKPLTIFLSQFQNILVALLIAAGIISIAVGELVDGIFIFIIIILNAIFGFIQEFKAENAIASLKKMTSSRVRVLRDSVESSIESRELLPGDVIKLEQGDKIPADAMILIAQHFEVNEASLTGESLPVSKIQETSGETTLFLGTIVAGGTALAKITAIGQATRIGSMAGSLEDIGHEKTPLMHKINTLGSQLSIIAISITVAIFFIGIAQQRELLDMLLTSISLAVAAIPEGLPAVITITLAVGLQRMAKQHAILRKLGAIEGLGNTTVIATDKTGTLTENKMNVLKLWTYNKVTSAEEFSDESLTPLTKQLITAGILCNNATIVHGANKKSYEIIGDQTEGSLLLMAKKAKISLSKITLERTLVDEFSFDAKRKQMTMVWNDNGSLTAYSKGAPERILAQSTHVQTANGIQKLTPKLRNEITNQMNIFAADGLRILGLGYQAITASKISRNSAEKDLVFLGLAGIADPARKGLEHVISMTKNAGIRTIMITGDNLLTAENIARQIGLIEDGDRMVTGDELARMSDNELRSHIATIRIFARATPEDKLRIVQALQANGEIVSVTGDGVNDALALKQAQVGIAMGITGTDVAKEVADMIILDDQYQTIVAAIAEGRVIFQNIVKSITYLVTCNLGEVLTILGAILLSLFLPSQLPAPLIPIQILWLNLVTDGLPALSLAFDPGAPEIMHKQYQHGSHTLISRETLRFIIPTGIIMAMFTLAVFIWGLAYFPIPIARAMSFTAIVMIQLVIVYIVRKQSIFSNRLLLGTVVGSAILQLIVVFFPPLSSIFVK